MVLSYLTPNDLKAAIVREDVATLQSVKGIEENRATVSAGTERQTPQRPG